MPKPKPREYPREYLHHHRQPVALVSLRPPQRQHRPPVSQIARICRGIAILVYDPPLRHRRPPCRRHPKLARRHGARRHIYEHRPLQIARHSDANRICPQARLAPPKRHYPLGRPPGVRRHNPNHPLLRRHQRIVRHTPHMALPKHRRRRDAMPLSLVYRDAHSPLRHRVAKPPVPVYHRRSGRLSDNVKRRARNDMPPLDPVYVRRDLYDPMRIMPRQIRPD